MKIIKVTNIEKFADKVLPKQPQKNKIIVESILKNVKKNGDVQLENMKKNLVVQIFHHYVYLKEK